MTAIAENRRARLDHHIEERYEAGIVPEGWGDVCLVASRVH